MDGWTLHNRENKPDKTQDISIETFYFWFSKHGNEKMKKYLLLPIGRMARKAPDMPVRVLIEAMCEDIFKCEEDLRNLGKGIPSRHGTSGYKRAEVLDDMAKEIGFAAVTKAKERRSRKKIPGRDITIIPLLGNVKDS